MGYYWGRVIPDVDKYLLPIVLGIIMISFVPSIIHIIQERRDSKKDWAPGVRFGKIQARESRGENTESAWLVDRTPSKIPIAQVLPDRVKSGNLQLDGLIWYNW